MIDTNTIASQVTQKADSLVNDPKMLLYGVILIILAVIILKFLKNIILNSIIGVAGLLISDFVFGIKLPFLITLFITAIFGPAGLGTMFILRFFGLV